MIRPTPSSRCGSRTDTEVIYCDTSLLVAVLTPERNSAVARRWIGRPRQSPLVVSAWVGVEMASALAMKHRRGVLDGAGREEAWTAWRNDLVGSMRILKVEVADFERAQGLMDAGHRGLRAGDALHLALALRHASALATLDVDLASAAGAMGLDAPNVITSD